MEIEEVAARTPEKILTVHVDPAAGLQPFHARRVAFGLGLPAESIAKLEVFLGGLYRLFVEKDASLAEINPLVVTKSGDLLALDCKLNFDDNALYRHPDVRELRDPDEEDAREREANGDRPRLRRPRRQHRLHGERRRPRDGDARHASSAAGGKPANFLDVGGGADQETVAAGLQADPRGPAR